jgi:hypothetical protein
MQENDLKNSKVTEDTGLKKYLVNYVGEQLDNSSDEVTVNMIVEVMSKEFPEFLFVIAEENFFRGYKQAMTDLDTVKALQKEVPNNEDTTIT